MAKFPVSGNKLTLFPYQRKMIIRKSKIIDQSPFVYNLLSSSAIFPKKQFPVRLQCSLTIVNAMGKLLVHANDEKLLQQDLNALHAWSIKWDLNFNVEKAV